MGRIPTKEIYGILSGLDGVVGLYIEDCSSGEKLVINPDEVFPAASVIKIPMLGLLLRDGDEGRVDLREPHTISPENRVGGTGILCDLDPGYRPSLYDMGKLMIVMSDNIATNEVMDVLGVDRFHAFCREQDCAQFVWQRKMMDTEAVRRGLNNYLCPYDTGRLTARIARGEFLSKEISDTIFRFMCAQKYRNKLPALLPAIPSYVDTKGVIPEGSVLCGNKTGDLVGIQHDVGIFELPDHSRYVIAMMTKELARDLDGINAIAQVSAAVYSAFQAAK